MWTLGLLPLFLSITVSLFTFRFALQAEGWARETCRRVALDTQAALALNLTSLEALNPSAKSLRLARQRAEAALAAALLTAMPPIIAKARAQLTAVQVAQQALGARQKMLLWQSKKIARTSSTQLHHPSLSTLNVSQGNLTHPGLSVDRTPEGSPTPDHNPTEDFYTQQTITYRWRVDLLERSPDWLKRWIPTGTCELQSQCSATLIKENGKWTAALSRGKSS